MLGQIGLLTTMYTINSLSEQLSSATRAERIAFIDFKVKYEGQIIRTDITDEFGISEAIASKDINEYKVITNDLNLIFNKGARTNLINTETYQPLIKINAKTALEMLFEGFCRNKIRETNSHLYMRGCNDTVELPEDTVSIITRAIHQKHKVKCTYISGNSSNHDERELEPTSVYFDGLNWVFRAYDVNLDPEKSRFKSFHFSRVKEVASTNIPSKNTVNNDSEWNTILPIQLVLHPELKEKDKIALRLDFGIPENSDELVITEKIVLAWSLLDRWKVDTNITPIPYPCFNFHLKNADVLKYIDSVKFKITDLEVRNNE